MGAQNGYNCAGQLILFCLRRYQQADKDQDKSISLNFLIFG